MTSQEMPRTFRMRMWMRFNRVTDKALAEKFGVSQPTVNRMLNKEVMPVETHKKFLELGFPEEILPTPFDGLQWVGDKKVTAQA